ncbi:MAG TPA: hypothetical protein VN306_14955 [Mycobacterium sp.]|nr:hypothetical protein [Mycobacterium sp.]
MVGLSGSTRRRDWIAKARPVAFEVPGGAFINGQTIVVDGGWSSTKYLSELALNSEWKAP